MRLVLTKVNLVGRKHVSRAISKPLRQCKSSTVKIEMQHLKKEKLLQNTSVGVDLLTLLTSITRIGRKNMPSLKNCSLLTNMKRQKVVFLMLITHQKTLLTVCMKLCTVLGLEETIKSLNRHLVRVISLALCTRILQKTQDSMVLS